MQTPVQKQYWELKNKNPDAILFFRLGDFYEMFYEDAIIVSKVLGITLTARHKGTDNEMPMAGFPYHSHKEYLETLIKNNYKVAIAEQVEDSQTQKITRKIDRIVTPGVNLESGNLNPEKNNFVANIMAQDNNFAISYSDLSTGTFKTIHFKHEVLFFDELFKIAPKEILLSSTLFQNETFTKKLPNALLTPVKNISQEQSKKLLKNQFSNLDTFQIDKLNILLESTAQVLSYLKNTQQADLRHIQKITRYYESGFMHLDNQTFRHLEIFNPLYADDNAATLYSVFNKSNTAMGGRMLREFIARPLLDKDKIQTRLDTVQIFTQNNNLAKKISDKLKNIADIERIIARIIANRGNARDLLFLNKSLSVFPDLIKFIQELNNKKLTEKFKILNDFNDLNTLLSGALLENPPVEIMSGGMIKSSYSKELAELRILSQESKQWLDNFLLTQKEATQINNLRIKYSKNFGFALEVSIGQINKVPKHWQRKQTLVNAERYILPELIDYQERVLSSEQKSFELEHKFFIELRDQVIKSTTKLQKTSQVIGYLDSLITFAATATNYKWTKPEILGNSKKLEIINGRHPVVEKISDQTFVANSLEMKESRLHIITGPNMAGKSTFLRQNALIILLGQIGSFVPAEKASYGIVDRVFTRVGASDNLSGGKSTFFVEMNETANILHASTENSFIILDEIGRGTSTFDGISLAWSISEFLHNKIKAKTLFATHYHELIDLGEQLKNAKNFHVSVSQNHDGIVFLRKIKEGGISDSFGIEVAKIAGIPQTVVNRSQEILVKLENENKLNNTPTLFSLIPEKKEDKQETTHQKNILNKIEKEDLNQLSPKEALDYLFNLKKEIETNKN